MICSVAVMMMMMILMIEESQEEGLDIGKGLWLGKAD